MQNRKIECENGWIVFIVNGNQVTEVHSTGLVESGNDDRGSDSVLFFQLELDAYSNMLHSQQPGRCGVRWPEDA